MIMKGTPPSVSGACARLCVLYTLPCTIHYTSRHWPKIRKNFHQLTQKLLRVHYIMCVLNHGIGSGPLTLNDWWRVAISSNPSSFSSFGWSVLPPTHVSRPRASFCPDEIAFDFFVNAAVIDWKTNENTKFSRLDERTTLHHCTLVRGITCQLVL